MQAILTKVIPATNTRPTRIKASCARGSLTVGADMIRNESGEYLAAHDNRAHAIVARMLCDKFAKEDANEYCTDPALSPWGFHFVTGCLPNGDFAHVFIGK